LPIQLHDGGIASVSACIPWPNPLTNGVELSVRSLDLVFHLLPRVANDVPSPSTNLADSISEAAQLFSHEEITQEESTEAHQAFQSSGASHLSKNDDYVPGGLDASTDEHEVISDVDPTGISMFASMFEYLLSQFTFSAKDINITVIHPGHSSFRFKVSELRFGRPTSDPGGSTRTVSISGVEIAHRDISTSESPSSGHSESRSLRTSQSKFGAPSHRVHNAATVALPSSLTPSSSPEGRSGSNEPLPSVDSSTSEDSSRPGSPSGSTTSSLFQSALTTQGFKLSSRCEDTVDSQEIGAEDMEQNSRSAMVGGRLQSQTHETMEDGLFHRVIVSLAMEPIVIHITTSAPPVSSNPSSQTQTDTYTFGSGPSGLGSLQPNLEISVSVGIVACALAAPQISAILEVISVIGTYSSPSAQPPVSNKPGLVVPPLSLLDQANLAIQIRGFVLLLQSGPASLTGSSYDVPLADFFAHPLTPPKTDQGYVRFLIDRLKADLSVSTTLEQVTDEPTLTPEHLPERSRVPWVVRGTTSSHFTFSVDDLSAFAFYMPDKATISPASHGAFVLPIILTDPLLFTQYRPEHQPPPNVEHHPNVSPEFIHKAVPVLPEFEVLDWTSENNRTSQVKLSLWRVKPPPGYRRSQRDYTGDSPISPPVASSPKTISREMSANKPQVALSGQVSLSTPKDSGMDGPSESTCSVQIYITPLHVFVDMGSIAAASDFLETLSVPRSSSCSFEPKGEDHEGARRHGGDLTPLLSPQRTTLQRIRQQELEGLNLSVDYLSKDPVSEELSPGLRKVQIGTEVLSASRCTYSY
jgi:autophagy-related protein 2